MAVYLTNKKDIERMKKDYFQTFLVENQIKEALTNFSNKTEFGDQYIGLVFAGDVEHGDGEAYENLLKEDRKNHVLVHFDAPVEPEDTYLYLEYKELYESLENWIKEQYNNTPELLDLLESVKIALEC